MCRLTKGGLDGAMHDAVPAIAALGVSPIVRLADLQGWMVKRMCIPQTPDQIHILHDRLAFSLGQVALKAAALAVLTRLLSRTLDLSLTVRDIQAH